MTRRRGIFAILISLLISQPSPFPLHLAYGATDAPIPAPLQWRVLLIIKANGEISQDGLPPVRYAMSWDEILAVKQAFTEFTGDWVKTLSKGRILWNADAVISDAPLTKVSKMGKGVWVSPECVTTDIEKYAPFQKYDGIFVYWKGIDDVNGNRLDGGFGWSIGPSEAANGCGYSCVHSAPSHLWGRDSETTEIFLHEWLHHLEAFCRSKGVVLPRGGLHGNDNYGFQHERGWKHWYEAFLNAELKEPDGTLVGLGEPAWRLGTIRAEQSVRLPGFVTMAVRKKNLFANGSFENEEEAWSTRSWRGNANASSLCVATSKEGSRSFCLQCPEADDVMCWQSVSVKPKTRYLLSGWVRTEAVSVKEQGGSMGANLSVWGGYESSRPVSGTKDWTYLSLIFNTNERTSMEAGARLGHHGSTATGKAWFDDLLLVELP